MGFQIQKACLKILAVCCSNHVLNADLALFKVGFYKPVWLCVGEIQYAARCVCVHKCNCSGKILCLLAAVVKRRRKMARER